MYFLSDICMTLYVLWDLHPNCILTLYKLQCILGKILQWIRANSYFCQFLNTNQALTKELKTLKNYSIVHGSFYARVRKYIFCPFLIFFLEK